MLTTTIALFAAVGGCDSEKRACYFSGPGSYSDFSRAGATSKGVALRRCRSRWSLPSEVEFDFHQVFLGKAQLDDAHPLRRGSETSMLLIGDSTDREVIVAWCEALASLGGEVRRWQLAGSGVEGMHPQVFYAHKGCRVVYDTNRTFRVANFMTFGVVAPAAEDATSIRLMYDDAAGGRNESVDAAERVATVARPTVVRPGLEVPDIEDPTYVVAQSCMWDMNRNRNTSLAGPLYTPEHVTAYAAGFERLIAAIRREFPTSRLWLATCKPPSKDDPPPAARGLALTRTRRLAAALDGTVKMIAGDHRMRHVVDGVIDAAAILAGLESYAPDGRHYGGAAAVTYLNTLINEVARNDDPREDWIN